MSSRTATRTRAFATIAAATCLAAVTLIPTGAGAAIVPTVPLRTASQYAVLAGSTVTNTGNSVLNGSLGLAPGSSVTGFPPGQVVAPGVININNGPATQAKADLVLAYDNAAGRPLDATTAADLTGLTLQGGVYATESKGALGLTGTLTLDGAGNANSVFIFQTNSTLITGTSSRINLINGAQACNVFWQVGSSATLGENSVFVGNILALTSISVNNGVTVQGRALARNGAVTLIDDTFTRTACATAQPTTTTPAGPTTTTVPGTTTTTVPGTTTTTTPVGSTPTTTPVAGTPVDGSGASGGSTSGPVSGAGGSGVPLRPGTPTGGGTGTATPTGRTTTSSATPGTPTRDLARTGSPLALTFLVGLGLISLGAGAVRLGRNEQ